MIEAGKRFSFFRTASTACQAGLLVNSLFTICRASALFCTIEVTMMISGCC
ncbi:hypothetical protein JCM18909_4093 [Cutibacterium acnes JCM 18909]|nr:hypothetical protein JCM18909_4093 [Cutibacterium acnes JCM 18909]